MRRDQCIKIAGTRALQRAGHIRRVRFDLDVVERAEPDTAFEAVAHLGGIVLEPPERVDRQIVGDYDAVADDRQIVSKAWIDTSTSIQIKATDGQAYGYLWWLGGARLDGRVVTWVGGLGRGGQSIRIVPELDLVVAVTAGYYQDYSPRAFQAQFWVFRDVLRAVSAPG